MGKIEESWKSFEAAILHPVVTSDVQRTEMRRAFFAGAHSALCHCHAVGDDSVSEDDGVKIMQAMMDECTAFAVKVKFGEA